MSDLAKQLFDRLKQIGPEVGAEAHRLGGLGASELAAALFKGDPFVMYGPGQRAAKVEQEHSVFGPNEPSAEKGHEAEREKTRER